MSPEKEHIDKSITEKLLQAEVAPPAFVWDGIEAAMAMERKMAVVMLYRRVGYAAAAILIIGFFAYYFSLSDRFINPSENKLSQQLSNDSLLTSGDSISFANKEEQGLEEKDSKIKPPELEELQKTMPVISEQKEVALSSLAKTENSFVSKEKQILIAVQTIPEENSTAEVLKSSIESIAAGKPAQSIELLSLYKSRFNPLSLLKANVYKRMLENEEMFNLLTDNSSKSERQGWSVGLAIAPTSIGRSSSVFTPNSEAYYDMTSSQMSVVSEKDLPAYSGGVDLVYHFSDRWSLQSGIYYLKQGQRIENFSVLENSINASNSSNSYFGNINFSNIEPLTESGKMADFAQLTDAVSYTRFDADLLQLFELLEIPFIANYRIINSNAIFSVLAGINSGFLVGNRVYLSDYLEEPIGKTEAINTLIFKSVLGLSIEYPIYRKLYFNLGPTFKYQLNNFNKNAIVSEKLLYFEIKMGLNYQF